MQTGVILQKHIAGSKTANCTHASKTKTRNNQPHKRSIRLEWTQYHITLIFCLFTSFSYGQGLKHSHHDFTGKAWGSNSRCKPCHAPHNISVDKAEKPIWFSEISLDTFITFADNTKTRGNGEPTGKSKLCLSCHDGLVAMGTYHESMFFYSIAGTRIKPFYDHPISVLYADNLLNNKLKLRNQHTALSGLGGTIETDMLENGYLECTSCHDTHLFRNNKGCASCHHKGKGANNTFTKSVTLWKSNYRSALCLTCHNM